MSISYIKKETLRPNPRDMLYANGYNTDIPFFMSDGYCVFYTDKDVQKVSFVHSIQMFCIKMSIILFDL